MTVFMLAACTALLICAANAAAGQIKCTMKFDLVWWSFIYKYGEGSGRITCSDGQAANVRIVTHGGGATLGGQKVIGGTGSFSSVADISELYGGYAEADVHAGAGVSADARVVLKSNVTLSLAGSGQGINLGIAFGSFSIQPK